MTSDAPTSGGASASAGVAGRDGAPPGSGVGVTYRGQRIVLDPHNCFACGELNEHGLHLVLHTQDGRCWTELELDQRFEGWDGIAHGGIVATILDEVMAWALIDTDAWGLTARMDVGFKRPVPLGAPIRGEGWVVEARRRLMTTAGRIVDAASGTVLATAEATYVAAPADRREALRARYRFRVTDDATGGARRPAGDAS